MSDVRIALVVAAARNDVIGANGQLPWRIPSDLKLFKALTLGKPVIMGRKTFEAIGKPLPGRDNIVVSRTPELVAATPDISVAKTITDAISLARTFAEQRGCDEIAVIGGAEIYRQTLGRADRIYLTRVDAAPEGDATFETPSPDQWRLVERRPIDRGQADDHRVELLVFDRVSSGATETSP